MLHACIFAHESESVRAAAIADVLESHKIVTTDTIILTLQEEKEHIGIDPVREFTRRMMLGPTGSPYVAGIIPSADLLTVDAQNALLKIIEEPPSRALFFLGTPAVDALLPTILSRCQVIQVNDEDIPLLVDATEIRQQIESLLSSTPSEILSIIQSIAIDRAQTKRWTFRAVAILRELLVTEVNTTNSSVRLLSLTRTIHSLEKVRRELAVNVTPRLALEIAFLES